MNSTRKNNDFIDINQKGKPYKKSPIREIFDGSLLTRDIVVKQLPFILFLTFLAVIYIGNRYHAERIIRETSVLQTEIKDLRSEAISTSSELMYISKQSEVIKLIKRKNLDLIESKEQPIVIKIKNK